MEKDPRAQITLKKCFDMRLENLLVRCRLGGAEPTGKAGQRGSAPRERNVSGRAGEHAARMPRPAPMPCARALPQVPIHEDRAGNWKALATQVFWLVDHPPSASFPSRSRVHRSLEARSNRTVAVNTLRPHLQRRDRVGFAPTSLRPREREHSGRSEAGCQLRRKRRRGELAVRMCRSEFVHRAIEHDSPKAASCGHDVAIRDVAA